MWVHRAGLSAGLLHSGGRDLLFGLVVARIALALLAGRLVAVDIDIHAGAAQMQIAVHRSDRGHGAEFGFEARRPRVQEIGIGVLN